MWNCRKCNAEVDDGFEVCWSCGTSIDGREDPDFVSDADLAPDASAPVIATAEALVTIASPALPEHAHVLRCHLEAAGIDVFIADEPVSGFDWLLHRGPEPIHLQVRETDADRAKTILAEIPSEEKAPPADDRIAETVPPPAPAVWEPENQAALDPQEYIRALESKLSSLMDEQDTPDWKVNPAFHPEVTAFIQSHANNAGFLKKAQSMQQNRAKYFAVIRQQAETKAAADVAEAEAVATPEPADVPMCEEVTAEAAKPRRRFRVPRFIIRLAKWTAILLVVAIIGVFLAATTYRQLSERELAETIARIDETDPNWRWDDLQAKRAQVPDKENAALKVLAIAEMLPENWPERDALEKEINGLEPNMPLDEARCRRLREMLEKHKRAVSEARSLTSLSTGRFDLASDPMQLALGTSAVKPVQSVRSLLFLDAAILAQTEKSMDGTLVPLRALLVCARSIGDEPWLLAQFCRISSRRRGCLGLDRALAQGQASEGELHITQKLLQDEVTQSLMLYALKGERAWVQRVYGRFEDRGGTGLSPAGKDDKLIRDMFEETYHVPLAWWLQMGWVKENHALTLDLLTEAVQLAKLPVEEQAAALDRLEEKCEAKRAEGWPEGRYVPATDSLIEVMKAARIFVRSQAELRCTIAALAAERYRLANDHWPNSLDALVPEYLPKVPVDPYDGKPLRMRRLDDGLVIYSIGPDREDNQGTLDPKAQDLKGKDIGFRLWDVERRGHRNEPRP